MASGHFAVVYRQIGRLFRLGSVAGLSEGQLLDRFVASRDDAAFEAILARHGAMVLGVCRAILRDPNDVEDAFQATFLILVKKADALRNRDLLGNWLYGVAHRVAKRARIEAARRRDRIPTGPEPSAPPDPDLDLRSSIHEEVNRLPQSYRSAIILCYLEGRTHEEAARELGWPVGTVRGRLARARDLLRTRLSRHGLSLSTGGILTALAKEGDAAVPPALVASTCAASTSITVGSLVTALAISPRVIALTEGVLHTMSATKLKLGVTLLVAVGLTGPGVTAYQGPDPGPPASRKTAPMVNKPVEINTVTTEIKNEAIKPPTPIMPATPAGKSATIHDAPAEGRVQIAEAAIATLEVERRKGHLETTEPQVLRWLRRLIDAQIEEGASPVSAANIYVVLARGGEARAKSLFQSDQLSKLDYLNAQFERAEAEKFANQVLNKKAPTAPTGSINGLKPSRESHGEIEIGAIGESEPPRLRKLPKPNPADEKRNKVIEQMLEEKLAMPFPGVGTDLEDILKYIKTNTVSKELDFPAGIPIYVDPLALVDTSENPPKPKTLKTTVPIDLDGIPLRVTLRLVLDQFSLSYQVRDQMIYIMDEELLDMRYNGGFVDPPTNPGGMGGGMGGMGSMRGMKQGGGMLKPETPPPSEPAAKK